MRTIIALILAFLFGIFIGASNLSDVNAPLVANEITVVTPHSDALDVCTTPEIGIEQDIYRSVQNVSTLVSTSWVTELQDSS